MQIGYELAAEAFGPDDLIRQTVLAEQAGFDFVEISDHFHPWLDVQGHPPSRGRSSAPPRRGPSGSASPPA